MGQGQYNCMSMASVGDTKKFVCVNDFEKEFCNCMSRTCQDYGVHGGARETTLQENVSAFESIKILPNVLKGDMSKIDVSTTVLGERISMPIGVAPIGGQCLFWPEGEVDSAIGTARSDTCYMMSTFSTLTMEDVTKAAPSGLRWFQMYICTDRDISREHVAMAEAHGFKALVLTVDSPVTGRRWHTMRRRLVLPKGVRYELVSQSKDTGERAGLPFGDTIDPKLTWADVDWLRSITRLPIIIKGIMTKEDAILAVEHGASGIVVSNHGGRQLDTVAATIYVLPEIVSAVGNKAEIYVDGGIRLGTDVFKALALGARAVFVGKPILWGLGVAGAIGVQHVLKILREELNITMALCGCNHIHDIKRSHLILSKKSSL